VRPASLPPPEVLRDRHDHGTRVRYVLGCRCDACRRANTTYAVARYRAQRIAGDWNGLVPAAAARKHLVALSRRGVGLKSVAATSDVPKTTLAAIKARRRVQIRARTERRILSVDAGARGDGSLVSARRTWLLIHRLPEEGYTRGELARRLGSRAKAPALQIQREYVLARTALRVERLYRRCMQ